MSETPSASAKSRRRWTWLTAAAVALGVAVGGFRTYRTKLQRSRAAAAKSTEPKADEKCDGDGWCRQVTGPNVAEQLIRGVWAHSAHDVWLVDAAGFLGHWDGARWGVTHLPSPGNAIWGFGPRELWIASNHAVLEGDGTTWKSHPIGSNEIQAIHGTSSKDMWAVATWSGVHHYDGNRWTFADLGKHEFEWFSTVWAVSYNDVWVAGGPSAAILHFDGGGWKLHDLPVRASITGLWAAASNDIWAVGDWGKLIHYDGHSWTQVPSPAKRGLNAVWGSSSHDVWAVGEDGVILHYDGKAWILTKPDWRQFFAVTGTPDQQLWAVGIHGQIVHWHGKGWKAPPPPPAAPAANAEAKSQSATNPASKSTTDCTDYSSGLKRGRLLTTQQRYDEAIATFDAVVRARPLDAAVRSERGYARLLAGDAAMALQDLARAEALTKNPQLLRQIWFNLALSFEKVGKQEEARLASAVAAFYGSDAANARLKDRSRCTAIIEPLQAANSRVVTGLEQLANARKVGCRVPVSAALDPDQRWRRKACVDCGGVNRCKGDEPALVPSGIRDKRQVCFLSASLGADTYFYDNTTYCTEAPKVTSESNHTLVTTNILGIAAESSPAFGRLDGLFGGSEAEAVFVSASGHWSDENAGTGASLCVPSLKGELPLGQLPYGKAEALLMPRSPHRRILVYSKESHRVVLSLGAYTEDVQVHVESGKVMLTGGGCSETIDSVAH